MAIHKPTVVNNLIDRPPLKPLTWHQDKQDNQSQQASPQDDQKSLLKPNAVDRAQGKAQQVGTRAVDIIMSLDSSITSDLCPAAS